MATDREMPAWVKKYSPRSWGLNDPGAIEKFTDAAPGFGWIVGEGDDRLLQRLDPEEMAAAVWDADLHFPYYFVVIPGEVAKRVFRELAEIAREKSSPDEVLESILASAEKRQGAHWLDAETLKGLAELSAEKRERRLEIAAARSKRAGGDGGS